MPSLLLPLVVILLLVRHTASHELAGNTIALFPSTPNNGDKLLALARAFLVKIAHNPRVRKVIEQMNAGNSTLESVSSRVVEPAGGAVTLESPRSQGISPFQALLKNTTDFLHLLPNLIGDSLLKSKHDNASPYSSSGVRLNISTGAMSVVDKVRELLGIMRIPVRCQRCKGSEGAERARRSVESSGSGLPSGGAESIKAIDFQIIIGVNYANMSQGVEPKENYVGSGSGLSSKENEPVTIPDLQKIVRVGGGNKSQGVDGETTDTDQGGSGLSSSGQTEETATIEIPTVPTTSSGEGSTPLRLRVDECLSKKVRKKARESAIHQHQPTFGETLNSVLGALLKVLSNARPPVRIEEGSESQSPEKLVDFRHLAREQLWSLVNLTRQLEYLSGNLSKRARLFDCLFTSRTASTPKNINLKKIGNKCTSLVKILLKSISEALSFSEFAYYFSDIASQVKKRCSFSLSTNAPSAVRGIATAHSHCSTLPSKFLENALLSAYSLSVTHPFPSKLNTTSPSKKYVELVKTCEEFDALGEESVARTLCACEQTRLLGQVSEILNNSNFISAQEAGVFTRLLNLTCERSATMRLLLYSCPISWKVDHNVCKAPLFNLQCPSLSYAATHISAHWNAEVRDGYHTVLKQILEGVKIRGSLTKKKDSPFFRCGVKCGVGMMGISNNYETPLLVFSSTIEAVWFILFICTLYWICSKKRYRLSKFRTCYLFLQIPYALSTLLKSAVNSIYTQDPVWCSQDDVIFKGASTHTPEILCMIVGRLVHTENFLWVIGFLILNLYWYWVTKSIANGGTSLSTPQTSFVQEVKKHMCKDKSYVVEFYFCLAAVVFAVAFLIRTMVDIDYMGHPLMRTCIRAQNKGDLTVFNGPLGVFVPTFIFLFLSARKTRKILQSLDRMKVKGKVGKYREYLRKIYRRQAILGVFSLFFVVVGVANLVVLSMYSRIPVNQVQENFEDYLRCHLLLGDRRECDDILWTKTFWIIMRLIWIFRQANGGAMILLLSFAWKDTL